MNPLIRRFVPLLLVASLSSVAPAAVVFSWTGSQSVPDNNASGVAFSFNVSDSAISITDIVVTLDMAGGFNGDLYAYLSHGDGFAVLLNRAGRTSANDFGYANPGLAASFTGSALADIHLYQANTPSYNVSGQLTGTWGADGRDVDPLSALDTTPRIATLAGFNGMNPNGDWTVYFQDASPGGISTLNAISVSITAVPEPKETVVGLGLALLAFGLGRQHRVRGKRSLTDTLRRFA
jgi:subtilisin-like proprotein convertase family protein